MPTFLVYHILTKALLKFSTGEPFTKPVFDHTPARRRFETDFFIIVDQMTEGSSNSNLPIVFHWIAQVSLQKRSITTNWEKI